MTPRSLLSIAVTALLALATQPRLSAAAAADTLIVVTLNLWHDSHDWPRRLAAILPELRRIRPDVLLLQEVLQHATLRNQAETLADNLGCHVQFASVDGPERPKRYGNAVLTRTASCCAASATCRPTTTTAQLLMFGSNGADTRWTPTRRTCTTRPMAARFARRRFATCWPTWTPPAERAPC